MIERVYKYTLLCGAQNQYLELPKEATILHFAIQHGKPTIWVKADCSPAVRYEKREFLIRGTGHDIDYAKLHHVGTTLDGHYVWHLFEILSGNIPV